MRKLYGYLVVTACSLFFVTSAHSAVNLQVGFDFLTLSDGSTPVPNGTLVQLIASTGNTTRDAPTSSSFVGGDDVLLGFAEANDFGVPNAVATGSGLVSTGLFNLDGLAPPATYVGVTSGDTLFLRWWPTLTSAAAAPGTASFLEATLNQVVPSDGAQTNGLPGFSVLVDLPNSTGAVPSATADPLNVFSPAADFAGVIPEPSSILLLGLGFSAFLVRRRDY
jgi:hypothetical protein